MTYIVSSDLFNQDKWSAWQNHCKKVLGPEETRSSAPGSTPFEKYSDGSNIKPVHEGTRCYPTGFTYQRQNLFSAPNANSKLGPDGNLDVLTQYRALLTKVSCDKMEMNKNAKIMSVLVGCGLCIRQLCRKPTLYERDLS